MTGYETRDHTPAVADGTRPLTMGRWLYENPKLCRVNWYDQTPAAGDIGGGAFLVVNIQELLGTIKGGGGEVLYEIFGADFPWLVFRYRQPIILAINPDGTRSADLTAALGGDKIALLRAALKLMGDWDEAETGG